MMSGKRHASAARASEIGKRAQRVVCCEVGARGGGLALGPATTKHAHSVRDKSSVKGLLVDGHSR